MCGSEGACDKRVNRLALEIRGFMPGAPGIVADPQSAVVGVFPRAYVQRRGIGGVDHDVVENEAIPAAEFGQAMPGSAFVKRFVEPTVGGAEEKMLGLAGHRMQRRARRLRRDRRR